MVAVGGATVAEGDSDDGVQRTTASSFDEPIAFPIRNGVCAAGDDAPAAQGVCARIEVGVIEATKNSGLFPIPQLRYVQPRCDLLRFLTAGLPSPLRPGREGFSAMWHSSSTNAELVAHYY